MFSHQLPNSSKRGATKKISSGPETPSDSLHSIQKNRKTKNSQNPSKKKFKKIATLASLKIFPEKRYLTMSNIGESNSENVKTVKECTEYKNQSNINNKDRQLQTKKLNLSSITYLTSVAPFQRDNNNMVKSKYQQQTKQNASNNDLKSNKTGCAKRFFNKKYKDIAAKVDCKRMSTQEKKPEIQEETTNELKQYFLLTENSTNNQSGLRQKKSKYVHDPDSVFKTDQEKRNQFRKINKKIIQAVSKLDENIQDVENSTANYYYELKALYQIEAEAGAQEQEDILNDGALKACRFLEKNYPNLFQHFSKKFHVNLLSIHKNDFKKERMDIIQVAALDNEELEELEKMITSGTYNSSQIIEERINKEKAEVKQCFLAKTSNTKDYGASERIETENVTNTSLIEDDEKQEQFRKINTKIMEAVSKLDDDIFDEEYSTDTENTENFDSEIESLERIQIEMAEEEREEILNDEAMRACLFLDENYPNYFQHLIIRYQLNVPTVDKRDVKMKKMDIIRIASEDKEKLDKLEEMYGRRSNP